MIPCTEFIPAYSELFKYLEARGGREAVLDFWNYLSDNFLHNLRDQVAANGIRGCWLYWNHTLNEEAADFTMELDEEAGKFAITMHRCPSKGMLLNLQHAARPGIPGFQPYHDYCGHCDVLYRRVLEPLGYEYTYDMSETDQARCRLVIRRKP
ncbi:MAG: hypothetical protein NT169_19835 [Chloroflexi bacterium]|nr:hypothetical protein [Chloroflexota bacterium]